MSLCLKKVSAMVLSLAILMTAMLMPGSGIFLKADAAPVLYGLWVNGEQFTSEHLTVSCGTGTAVFSPSDNSLTLNSATITKTDADGAGICATELNNLTVRLNGSSSVVVANDDAVSALNGTINIEDGGSGNGSLVTSASTNGLFASGNINIRSGVLSLGYTGGTGCAVKAEGNINVTGGTISCSGSNSMAAAKVVITGGSLNVAASSINPAPVNAGGTAVLPTEYTVQDTSAVTRVDSLNVSVNGGSYAYGTASMYTDASGRLVLWLPENAVVGSASTSTSSTSNTTQTTSTSTSPADEYPPYVRLTGNNIILHNSAADSSNLMLLPIYAWYPCTGVTTVSSVKWYKITVGAVEGWVSGTYATPDNSDSSYIMVNATKVNVRATAPSGRVLDTASQYAYYKYTATSTISGAVWYNIAFGNVSGWIAGAYCTDHPASSATTASTESTAPSSTSSTQSTAPSSAAATEGWLMIKGTLVNVHSGASTGDSTIEQVKQYAYYRYTATQNVGGTVWYNIKIGTKSGWVTGEFVQLAAATANYITLTGDNINMRQSAGSGTVITSLPINASYPYTETTAMGDVTWYKITVGPKSGWVSGVYAESTASTTASTTGSTDPGATTASTSATSGSTGGWVMCTGDKVRVRGTAGSTDSADIVANVNSNEYYQYSETTSINGTTWYKITAGSSTGWISGQFVNTVSDTNFIKVIGTSVNVRASASSSGTIICSVKQDMYYPYTETAKESGTDVTWYKIKVGSKSGWVCGQYVQTAGGTGASDSGSTGTTGTTAVTPPAALSKKEYVQAIGGGINVHDAANGAGITGSVTSEMKYGWFKYSETASISGVTWYKISFGNTVGWVSGTYFKAATAEAKYIVVDNTLVNVRGTAGTTDASDVVTTVPKYCAYPFTETQVIGSVVWYKITVNDKTGWISGQYVKLADPDTTATTASTTPTSATSGTNGESTPTSAVASGLNYIKITGATVYVRSIASKTGTSLAVVYLNGWYPYTDSTVVNNVTWYKIITGNTDKNTDNITGWVSGDYAVTATAPANYIRMTGDNVFVRSSAPSGSTVGTVRKYACFPFTETVTADGATWYKISYGNVTGWVCGKYAVPYTAPAYTPTSSTTPSSTSTTKSTTKPTTPTTAIDGTVRLEGSDRIDTAIKISKQGWADNTANTVVLASSKSYADALAGVPLAAVLDAPILLTSNGAALESNVLAELTRLGASHVYILGGTGVVNGIISSSLSTKYTVTRLAGANRYETAVAIAKELRQVTGQSFSTLYFASAANFPDALSISPVAGIEKCPVLYAPATGALDSATAEYVASLGCTNAVIVGGVGAVSDDAQTSIMTCGVTNVKRISGANRYETSLKINTAYNSLFAASGTSMATGKNFPDALAGGALSAKYKLPIILVDSGVTVSGLSAYVSERGFKTTYIYGGPYAVSNEAVLAVIS